MLAKYDVYGTINVYFDCGCELCLDIAIFYDSSIIMGTECRITSYELCEQHDTIEIDDIDCDKIFETIEQEYYHKLIKQYDSEAQVYVALLELYDDVGVGETLDDFIIRENIEDDEPLPNNTQRNTQCYNEIRQESAIDLTVKEISERAAQVGDMIMPYVQKIKNAIKKYITRLRS